MIENFFHGDYAVTPTNVLYTDIYSNYGIGYRFTPNLVFQYIFSTDYGQTRPRHSFLLRYTFDFKGK